MSYFRNTISKLFDPATAPVASTRDALAEKLQSVRNTVYLLYEKAKEKLEYGQALKDTMEHEAEKEEVKKQDVYDKSTTNYVYPFKRNSSVHRVI